ncbi:MFS transporter [Paenibacillus bouchesdurhonensis]|uniref:MFS transporter n=1 Tax=Paenibacillus bouchesdurhonensis TaxID=1870990 RepID=UPI000DA60050|nr:MFS transporter [Paenibacillus bouchesdurhonensis]
MRVQTHKLFYTIGFLQFFMSEITGTTLILFLLAKGLSLQTANFLLVIFFVSIFLFEIPTGAIADKYGRKISVILGLVCFLVYSILFMQSERIEVLVVAQVFGGLAICLQSGALESWAVENSHQPMEVLFTTANSIQYISGFICGLLGAFLAVYSYFLPWLASILSTLLAILLCVFYMHENKRGFARIKSRNVVAIIRESVGTSLQNKSIWIIFIIGLFISFSNSAGNTFQQPRLVGLSEQGVWIMGIIKAAYSLCMTLGSYLVRRLSKNNSDIRVLMYACGMIGVWLIFAGSLNTFYPVLMTFLIYEVGRGMYPAAKQIYLNKRISDEYRSTLLSFDSAVSQLGVCIGLIVTGIISRNFTDLTSDQTPIQISWILCGAVALVPVVLLGIATRKRRQQE